MRTYPVGIVPRLMEPGRSMLEVDLVWMWAWLWHGGGRSRGCGACGTPGGGQHQRSPHARDLSPGAGQGGERRYHHSSSNVIQGFICNPHNVWAQGGARLSSASQCHLMLFSIIWYPLLEDSTLPGDVARSSLTLRQQLLSSPTNYIQRYEADSPAEYTYFLDKCTSWMLIGRNNSKNHNKTKHKIGMLWLTTQ